MPVCYAHEKGNLHVKWLNTRCWGRLVSQRLLLSHIWKQDRGLRGLGLIKQGLCIFTDVFRGCFQLT